MTSRLIVDANIWFSRALRDWVLITELEGGPYKTYWTEDILAETLYRLRRKFPTWEGRRIHEIRRKITETVEGGLVKDFIVNGDSPWSDANDQHVHAAALACSADYLLTADTGFMDPNVDLDSLPYEVYRPDDFFELVDDGFPQVVRRVAARQEAYLLKRDGSADLCAALRRAGCPRFATRVCNHLQQMETSGEQASRGTGLGLSSSSSAPWSP